LKLRNGPAGLQGLDIALPWSIRRLTLTVHLLWQGPRAASELSDFGRLLEQATSKAPLHQLTTIEDVG
jgi:hypothetical protein